MSDCCKTGFAWEGQPVGKEATLGKNKAYVTGSNSDVAVLLIHDVFGWTFPNLRLLADHFAKEADCTVYLPDYFGGEVILPSMLEDPKEREKFDLMAFIGRNSKEIRYPEMLEGVKELKGHYKKIGAIGYCYGGWAVFQLGAKGNNYVDCISTAHPSIATKEEIANLCVPTQILAPETDPQLTPELKEYCNTTIPTLGIDYSYEYFPRSFSWLCRTCGSKNPTQKAGLERAKNAAVHWFKEYLH